MRPSRRSALWSARRSCRAMRGRGFPRRSLSSAVTIVISSGATGYRAECICWPARRTARSPRRPARAFTSIATRRIRPKRSWMWQRAGAAETMQAEIAALRETLSEVEHQLRRDAEEAVRIRADTAEARQAVEEALRAAEDGAVKVRGLETEIAALESALATARQVGRAALEAMAASQPAVVALKTPDGSWQ